MFDPAAMGGGPPQSISVPGGGGAPPAGGGGSSDDAVREAKVLIQKALGLETDDEDLVLLEKIATELQQILANSQKLVDTAMGAGPGVKMVRKAAQGSA